MTAHSKSPPNRVNALLVAFRRALHAPCHRPNPCRICLLAKT